MRERLTVYQWAVLLLMAQSVSAVALCASSSICMARGGVLRYGRGCDTAIQPVVCTVSDHGAKVVIEIENIGADIDLFVRVTRKMPTGNVREVISRWVERNQRLREVDDVTEMPALVEYEVQSIDRNGQLIGSQSLTAEWLNGSRMDAVQLVCTMLGARTGTVCRVLVTGARSRSGILLVFDVLGRRVETRTFDLQRGEIILEWNGVAAGQRVASGVYLLAVEIDARKNNVGKFLLVR